MLQNIKKIGKELLQFCNKKRVYKISTNPDGQDILPLQENETKNYFDNQQDDINLENQNGQEVVADTISDEESVASAENTTIEPSKLDNKEWVKVLTDIIRLGDELDKLKTKIPPEAKELADHIYARLDEMLDRNGAEIIDGESCYDIRRHQAIPQCLVEDGTEIESTISSGWSIEELVLRRAKVKVIKEAKEIKECDSE